MYGREIRGIYEQRDKQNANQNPDFWTLSDFGASKIGLDGDL